MVQIIRLIPASEDGSPGTFRTFGQAWADLMHVDGAYKQGMIEGVSSGCAVNGSYLAEIKSLPHAWLIPTSRAFNYNLMIKVDARVSRASSAFNPLIPLNKHVYLLVALLSAR